MNLKTVIENLERTIEGKKMFRDVLVKSNPKEGSAIDMMLKIVDLNLEELEKILADLKQVA